MTTTTACPDCDSAELRVRRGGGLHAKTADTRYLCKECGHEFDTAVERECRGNGGISAEAMLSRLGIDPESAMVGGEQ